MRRTTKTTAIVSSCIAAMLFTACNKEIDVSEPTKENLAGRYKITSMVLESPAGSADLFTTLDDCQKQSVQILNLNSSYQLSNACDAIENETGTWSVNGKVIVINGVPGELVSFNGRDLVIDFDQFLGMPGKLKETLTRQ